MRANIARSARPPTRHVFSAGLATDPLAAVPALSASGNPDAGLVEIARLHHTLLQKLNGQHDMPEEEADALFERIGQLEREAAAFPVATIAGLGAMCAIMRASDMPPFDYNSLDSAGEFTLALVEKIEALAAREA